MGVADEGPPRKRSRLCLRLSSKQKGNTEMHGDIRNRDADNDMTVDNLLATDSSSSSTKDIILNTTDDVAVADLLTLADPVVPPVASLHNLGNTCYMNCVLQVLRYTPGFVAGLDTLSKGIIEAESSENVDGDGSEKMWSETGSTWQAVQNTHSLFTEMERKEDQAHLLATSEGASMAVRPNVLLDNIRELNPMFEGHLQHDAQELLRCLLCYTEDAEKELRKWWDRLNEKNKASDVKKALGDDKCYDDMQVLDVSATSKLKVFEGKGTLKGGDRLEHENQQRQRESRLCTLTSERSSTFMDRYLKLKDPEEVLEEESSDCRILSPTHRVPGDQPCKPDIADGHCVLADTANGSPDSDVKLKIRRQSRISGHHYINPSMKEALMPLGRGRKRKWSTLKLDSSQDMSDDGDALCAKFPYCSQSESPPVTHMCHQNKTGNNNTVVTAACGLSCDPPRVNSNFSDNSSKQKENLFQKLQKKISLSYHSHTHPDDQTGWDVESKSSSVQETSSITNSSSASSSLSSSSSSSSSHGTKIITTGPSKLSAQNNSSVTCSSLSLSSSLSSSHLNGHNIAIPTSSFYSKPTNASKGSIMSLFPIRQIKHLGIRGRDMFNTFKGKQGAGDLNKGSEECDISLLSAEDKFQSNENQTVHSEGESLTSNCAVQPPTPSCSSIIVIDDEDDSCKQMGVGKSELPIRQSPPHFSSSRNACLSSLDISPSKSSLRGSPTSGLMVQPFPVQQLDPKRATRSLFLPEQYSTHDLMTSSSSSSLYERNNGSPACNPGLSSTLTRSAPGGKPHTPEKCVSPQRILTPHKDVLIHSPYKGNGVPSQPSPSCFNGVAGGVSLSDETGMKYNSSLDVLPLSGNSSAVAPLASPSWRYRSSLLRATGDSSSPNVIANSRRFLSSLSPDQRLHGCNALRTPVLDHVKIELRKCDCLGVSPMKSVSARKAIQFLNSSSHTMKGNRSHVRKINFDKDVECLSPFSKEENSNKTEETICRQNFPKHIRSVRSSSEKQKSEMETLHTITSKRQTTLDSFRVQPITRSSKSQKKRQGCSPKNSKNHAMKYHSPKHIPSQQLSICLERCDRLLSPKDRQLIKSSSNKINGLPPTHKPWIPPSSGQERDAKTTLVGRLFGGDMIHRTRCLECEVTSQRREEFLDISVPMKGFDHKIDDSDNDDVDNDDNRGEELKNGDIHSRTSAETDWCLSKLMEAFSSVERLRDINKYFCEGCDHLVEAERSCHYTNLPRVLSLHLKRFSSNPRLFGGVSKLNDKVSIPQHLPCLLYQCQDRCSQLDHQYSLYAIVTHSGTSLLHGHYRAYVKVQSIVSPALYNSLMASEVRGQHHTHAVSTTGLCPTDLKEDTYSILGHSPSKNGLYEEGKKHMSTHKCTPTGSGLNSVEKKTTTRISRESKTDLFRGHGQGCFWLECDDECIRVMSEEEFRVRLDETEGSLLGSPYVLFYHKLSMS